MVPGRQQTNATARFTCLGDRCPDTCCKGWGMQLTAETVELYKAKAPELLEAVTSGEAEFIMKRDPVSDFCVKLDKGWCSIHRDYGDNFLGDACHFYPRVTRALGEEVVTTLALSCPEAARLMLFQEDSFTLTPREEVRVPFSLKNYLPPELTPADAHAVHATFIEAAGSAEHSAERNLMRVGVMARALETQPLTHWKDAAGFYAKIAAGRLLPAEAASTDMIHLLHTLVGLMAAANRVMERERLMQTVMTIAEALGAVIQWENHTIGLRNDAPERTVKLLHHWRTHAAEAMQPVLRRYVQAQLSQAWFPFGGLGSSLSERITIISVRFAIVKLALMSEAVMRGGVPEESETVRIVQSLSRFQDHLADATLSLQIFAETGWLREARMRALLGDA